MKILISGTNGLVGTALVPAIIQRGDSVIRLTRRSSNASSSSTDTLVWDPKSGGGEFSKLEGIDAVIHLAGESIASGRWNEAKKERIKKSRVDDTRILVERLAQLTKPPKVFLCASAIGFYGDRGLVELDEKSVRGVGFLSDVCELWEKSTSAIQEKGARVAHLRFGVILSPNGGALAKMLLPFKMGVGGKIGTGQQYMSWVDLADVVSIILFALQKDTIRGPINVVAPNPVSNLEFTKTLGRVLSRPTVFPLPGFVARIVMGEMADALLLSSTRVMPRQLISNGYSFHFPDLESSLKHLLLR